MQFVFVSWPSEILADHPILSLLPDHSCAFDSHRYPARHSAVHNWTGPHGQERLSVEAATRRCSSMFCAMIIIPPSRNGMYSLTAMLRRTADGPRFQMLGTRLCHRGSEKHHSAVVTCVRVRFRDRFLSEAPRSWVLVGHRFEGHPFPHSTRM